MSRLSQRIRGAICAAGVLFLVIAGALPAHAARPDHIPQKFERAWQVQERYQRGLINRPGVVGVALGENAAGEPLLRIFTERPGIAGLPAVLDDQNVEIVVSGRFISGELAAQAGASAPTDRWPRPVPIGVSVGHQDVTAGTVGCQVFQSSGCHVQTFLLSNNHVLANSNLGVIGDPILQPGPVDGGRLPGDQLATLYQFEPVILSTSASNVMDAAIGLTTANHVGYSTPPDGYGAPRSASVNPTVNLAVRKYGRTTRTTTGRVTSINAQVIVSYSGGNAQFVQQFIVTGDNNAPFSGNGDSGSLVVVASGGNARKAVGLLFAGSGNYTAVNPIGPILQKFGVQISGDL